MYDAIKQNLTEGILPFWRDMKDVEHGGFYGERDFELNICKEADKGTILQSRILWSFSTAYRTLSDQRDLECAEWAYHYLRDHCVDKECGGLFWSTHFDGTPAETTKHAYSMAFGIYALSAYYDASGCEEALDLAKTLFQVIEEKCVDTYGYMEEFDRNFHIADNDKLSDTFQIDGKTADKTMNTLLHVLEAYTELYRVSHFKEAGERLKEIYHTFLEQVYNREKGRMEVFFDEKYQSLIDMQSFGHDIEASWLLDRGVEVLGDKKLTEEVHKCTDRLAQTVYERALRDGHLINENRQGTEDNTIIWWVQAEAVIGFENYFGKHPEETKYHEAAKQIWEFIARNIIDGRSGEWFNELNDDLTPKRTMGLASAWKCPYHDSRMCIEMMNRLKI